MKLGEIVIEADNTELGKLELTAGTEVKRITVNDIFCVLSNNI